MGERFVELQRTLQHREEKKEAPEPHEIRAMHDLITWGKENGVKIVVSDLQSRLRLVHGAATKYTEFCAWVNDRDTSDVGHMTALDHAFWSVYEFEMGKARFKGPRFGPALDKPFTVKAVDVRSKRTYSAQSKELEFSQLSPVRSASKQWAKFKQDQPRFTRVYIVTVAIKQSEYEHLRKIIALRIALGSYNFMREAQIAQVFATRCLTLLEELAKCRGQRLDPGTARALLEQFVQLNPDTIREPRFEPICGCISCRASQ